MNIILRIILRIAFAVVCGCLVTAVLKWITPLPDALDNLIGVITAFMVYMSIDRNSIV